MKTLLTGYPSIDKPQNRNAKFFEKNPIIPNLNIYSIITLLSNFYKKRIAIDCLELEVSYEKMGQDAKIISLALKELGIKKGAIVAISMPNFYQAMATFLACNRIGAITTFLNPAMSFQEITDYLNEYETPVYINFSASDDLNKKIIDKTKVRSIITLDKKNVCSLDLSKDYHITSKSSTIDFNSLGSISKFQKQKFEPKHKASEEALILYTSGTTGKPKSVVLTNENIIASGIYLKNSSQLSQNKDKRTLVCVPFAYPYGFATSGLMTLMSGKTAILAPDISGQTLSYYLKKNPNIIFGSPALLELIMRYTPEGQDLSSLTYFISGGDFLSISQNKRGKEFFKKHGANVEIGNGSGNAETVSSGTNPMGIKSKPETAGKILVGTEAIILAPDDIEKIENGLDANLFQEKKYHEEGVLCVAGKHVFKNYFNQPELTKKAKFVRNGITYFITGTLGFIDDEGYFTLTGRQSRFYITASLNKVYCDHVQNAICLFECVKDCAVVKTPDEKNLYVNTAFIVLDEKFKNIDQATIKDYILQQCQTQSQLKKFEIPTYIEIVDFLPRKQGTDKIDYGALEKISEGNIPLSKKLTNRPLDSID